VFELFEKVRKSSGKATYQNDPTTNHRVGNFVNSGEPVLIILRKYVFCVVRNLRV